MIVINVRLNVAEAKRQAYLEFVANLVEKSRQDSGNLFYGHYEDVKQRNNFIIVENWQDEEAVNKHNATPHLQNFLKNVGQFLTKDYEIQVANS